MELAGMDADEALRWLESLNAQQQPAAESAAPAEPAERAAEVPAWFAEVPLEPEMTGPPAEPEAEATVPDEPPEWLKAYVPSEPIAELPVQAAQPVAEPPAQTGEPVAPAPAPAAFQGADVEKLSRLSERLSTTRALREQEAEARFASQRERDEAARQEVQERMEARWAAEAAEAAKAASPAAVPTFEAPAAEEPAPEMAASEAPMPEVAAQDHPAAAPAISSEALAEILVTWTERVEAGHDLPGLIREMESVAPVDTAPVPVVQLLGDAYVRANQLQKALDTYRQALRRL